MRKISITNHQGNGNLHRNETSADTCSNVCHQEEVTRSDRDAEKSKPSYPVGGSVNRCSPYGKQHSTSSKIKNRITISSSNPPLAIQPKEMKTGYQEMCTFPCLLQPESQRPRRENSPSVGQWMNGESCCSICRPWTIIQPREGRKSCHFWQHAQTRGHYVKWDYLGREEWILYDLMWRM